MTDGLIELSALQDTSPAKARPLFGDDRALFRVVLAVGALVALWKLAIALTGNVIWEEGHFAVLGQRPDLAYPDIPAGWPLFALLCTTLFGWSAAAIRIPGLIVAECIPLAVYWLARSVTNRREALWAALIAILAPAMGASGTIFYPEEALQIALAVMLGGIIRAIDPERPANESMRYWAIAGLAGALGLFVHFRFVLAGGGVFLFLILAPAGRRQWTKPGLWLAAVIAALGLLPGLIYNMREHWPALAYQVANRPSYRFNRGWLLTFFENQLGLATPAFFVAFAVAARKAWREAREGQGAAALMLCVAGLIFGLYAALSLIDSQVMPHWPFMAYVALAPLAPGVLIRFVDRTTSTGTRRRNMALVAILGPAITLAGALAGTAFEEGWAHADTVPAAYRPLLFTRLEDWSRMTPVVNQAADFARLRFPGSEPAIASAGHVTALRLEFPGLKDRHVYALDEPYDEFTRFAVIRKAWSLDETGLRRDHANGGAVLVLPEPDYLYNTPGEIAFRRRLCGEFDAIRPAGFSELPPRRVAVELYSAKVLPVVRGDTATWCPLFPRLYIAQPTRAAAFKAGHDSGNLFGLASDPKGVAKVEVLLDGRVVSTGAYGQAPPGSPAPEELKDDPNYPKLWFTYTLPGAALTTGEHRLSLRATLKDGSTTAGRPRSIYVR